VRWVSFVVVTLLLGGCNISDPYVRSAGQVPSGNWRVDRQTDRITGRAVSSAQLMTRNSSHSGIDYAQPAAMQLTCFEGHPIVRISFDFKIGSDKNTILGYRFDEKPGRDNVESRVLLGYQHIVIEEKAAVAQFIDDLAGSSVLYIRIRSLNAGRTTAEFRLDGSAAAVQAAYSDCPVTGPQKRTS
jgi:hypothetical protein